MSSDKEPADIAIEFLAEDPASLWQDASPALKATKAIELFTMAVLGGRDARIEQLKLGKKVK